MLVVHITRPGNHGKPPGPPARLTKARPTTNTVITRGRRQVSKHRGEEGKSPPGKRDIFQAGVGLRRTWNEIGKRRVEKTTKIRAPMKMTASAWQKWACQRARCSKMDWNMRPLPRSGSLQETRSGYVSSPQPAGACKARPARGQGPSYHQIKSCILVQKSECNEVAGRRRAFGIRASPPKTLTPRGVQGTRMGATAFVVQRHAQHVRGERLKEPLEPSTAQQRRATRGATAASMTKQ